LVVAGAVLLAGAGAARPDSGWVEVLAVAVVVAAAVGAWQDGLGPGRIAAVAVVLYLHHAAATLAAAFRTDTLVPAAVLRHVAARTVVVLAGAAVLAVP